MNKVKSFKEFINESAWDEMRERGEGKLTRKEDEIPQQDTSHWWSYIKLDNPTKYPVDQVKSSDIISIVLYKLFNTVNIDTAEHIIIHFKKEDAWDLNIEHDTLYGHDRYIMSVHGPVSPWYIQFSKLTLQEKRSIRDRIEKRKFYAYKNVYGGGTQTDWHLREESNYKGEKGIELK